MCKKHRQPFIVCTGGRIPVLITWVKSVYQPCQQVIHCDYKELNWEVDSGLYPLSRLEGNRDNSGIMHVVVVDLPAEILLLKYSLPLRISSSCSKGMSPHTMS